MLMSLSQKLGRVSCALVLATLIGCRSDAPYIPPEEPMPPNTVMLSEMMRELSATPGFTDAVLRELDKGEKKGPALMTPALMHRLRELILGKDWQRLDRFPGWTMQEINPTVRVAGRVAGKNGALEDLAARHPGTPKDSTQKNSAPESGMSTAQAKQFIDLGPYTLEHADKINLNESSRLRGFSSDGLVSNLGAGVVRGDDANPKLAPLHSESQRIADVLNRLSLNDLDAATQATAELDRKKAASPQALIQTLMDSGHTVTVRDARYFANFGHFHYKGRDVMMPFWVSSQIKIPGTKRTLLIPVSHAEYEWEIRGPKINANVSWYFGIDGKAEFRTMDTLDQSWVLVRYAHEYRGDDAIEVTRLVGRMSIAYMHQHRARPTLPFGGYYTLGVCQDSVAAIEKKMTGKATLFPNTADGALFDDPRDAEVNALIEAIPKDRNGSPPEPERIFGSLPTVDLNAITIPGLSADLVAVQTAWHDGTLERTHSWTQKMAIKLLGVSAAILLIGIAVVRRRRPRSS